MVDLHLKTNYSGIWLDMNEPANFCNGECNWHDKSYDNPSKPSYINPQFNLPYMVGVPNQYYDNLNYKSLPLELLHFGGLSHKDVHNLYGLMDTIYTY